MNTYLGTPDTDTDMEIDIDTDTNADTDTDIDTETDIDKDTDTDNDMDTDKDTDTVSGTGTDTDADGVTDTDTGTDATLHCWWSEIVGRFWGSWVNEATVGLQNNIFRRGSDVIASAVKKVSSDHPTMLLAGTSPTTRA
jgi:hypothetical protein